MFFEFMENNFVEEGFLTGRGLPIQTDRIKSESPQKPDGKLLLMIPWKLSLKKRRFITKKI
jgi:hypothetical protein